MDDLISRQAAVDAICGVCQADCIPCEFDTASRCEMIKAIQALPPAQPNLQPTCNNLATDIISRQAAIDLFPNDALEWDTKGGYIAPHLARRMIEELPFVQPDGIPLEWIDKHLEWLDNCDNDFAQLAKVSIRAMVEIWKKDKT